VAERYYIILKGFKKNKKKYGTISTISKINCIYFQRAFCKDLNRLFKDSITCSLLRNRLIRVQT